MKITCHQICRGEMEICRKIEKIKITIQTFLKVGAWAFILFTSFFIDQCCIWIDSSASKNMMKTFTEKFGKL